MSNRNSVFILKCHPPKKCSEYSTCLTFVRKSTCVKQEMETDRFWHSGTVNQNDGLCWGHLVFLPIADSTQLMLTLIDRTGRGCLVQPFGVCFFFKKKKKLNVHFFLQTFQTSLRVEPFQINILTRKHTACKFWSQRKPNHYCAASQSCGYPIPPSCCAASCRFNKSLLFSKGLLKANNLLRASVNIMVTIFPNYWHLGVHLTANLQHLQDNPV